MNLKRTIVRTLLWLAALPMVLALAQVQALATPACFAPTELSARQGEEHPVKGDHRFDTPPRALSLAPHGPVAPELRGAIRRVELPKGKKLIALTFDLCEQPGEVSGYDGQIFDYLRANNIKATLFAGGKWLRSHESRAVQLMSDPLFEIANHAEAHRNLRLLTGTALAAEISGPQQAYETIRASHQATNQCLAPKLAATPPRLELFRFPYGACNPASLQAVNDAGLLAIQWDVATGDPSPGVKAIEIANAMVRGVKPGSIVISHANGRGWHTAEGLPLAIPKLKAAGYQFVTVSELLAAGKPVIVSSCYDSKPGDTDKYDHPILLRRVAPRTTATTPPGETPPWSSNVTTAPLARRSPTSQPTITTPQ